MWKLDFINPLRSCDFSSALLAGSNKFCWRKRYHVLKRWIYEVNWDSICRIKCGQAYFTQERIATRSRVKIRSARDTNDIFYIFSHTWNYPALVREYFKCAENQLSGCKTTSTRLTFGVCRTKNIFKKQ